MQYRNPPSLLSSRDKYFCSWKGDRFLTISERMRQNGIQIWMKSNMSLNILLDFIDIHRPSFYHFSQSLDISLVAAISESDAAWNHESCKGLEVDFRSPNLRFHYWLGLFFPRYAKVEHVPNHQPEYNFHKCPQLILMVSDIKTFFRTIQKQ